jgi:hypothetical protein
MLPLLPATTFGNVQTPAVSGYKVLFNDRYPYPPGLRKRVAGRIFNTPGAAVKAVGRRHHPFSLMPISISEAKEKPVQIRTNVGVKSQLPSQ